MSLQDLSLDIDQGGDFFAFWVHVDSSPWR